MGKQYGSIKDMIQDSDVDEGFRKKALKRIDNSRISKFLLVLRCKNGFTQKKLAKKLGCTQSRISKIETSSDNEISIKDLVDYGKALNLKLEIGYRKPDIKIVDLIKYHASKINYYLEKLVIIAEENKNDSIYKGIKNFMKEAHINLNAIVSGKIARLDFTEENKKYETIHISAPLEVADEKTEKENKAMAGK